MVVNWERFSKEGEKGGWSRLLLLVISAENPNSSPPSAPRYRQVAIDFANSRKVDLGRCPIPESTEVPSILATCCIMIIKVGVVAALGNSSAVPSGLSAASPKCGTAFGCTYPTIEYQHVKNTSTSAVLVMYIETVNGKKDICRHLQDSNLCGRTQKISSLSP